MRSETGKELRDFRRPVPAANRPQDIRSIRQYAKRDRTPAQGTGAGGTRDRLPRC